MKQMGIVKEHAYYDSVTLMGVSKKLLDYSGINKVSVSMGTDMNKAILNDTGFSQEGVVQAGPHDLMVCCQYEDDLDEEELRKLIDAVLDARDEDQKEQEVLPKSLRTAHKQYGSNLALISVPGIYAAAEAKKALQLGMNVMLFSDNVSLEDERQLKEFAHQQGLLVMGPDCGTSIVNGVGLCFANKVQAGGVGIVSASGTGAQEISVLLSRAGIGISQLIGVGGRDLKQEIGARMSLDALSALDKDENTELIVLISKPASPEVEEKINQALLQLHKPVVLCILGGVRDQLEQVYYSESLEHAAQIVAELCNTKLSIASLPQEVVEFKKELDSPHYVRALYCGGTLTEEARLIFSKYVQDAEVYSNTVHGSTQELFDVRQSQGHCFLDMGDDRFTQGKPHPMIDPFLRNERIIQEAEDVGTSIIMLDFVLGYGAHDNPVSATIPAIREAQEKARKAQKPLLFIAYVLGTHEDIQGYAQQVQMLKNEGVIVCESNAQAARSLAYLMGGEVYEA